MNKKLYSILLVDDDDGTNFLHKITIEEANVTENILVAMNGQEALDLIKNNYESNVPQPDLIFLDINMPIMNGWEFIEEYQKLKYSSLGKHIIVMLTCSLNAEDEAKSKKFTKISAFKNKPLTIEMLNKILENNF